MSYKVIALKGSKHVRIIVHFLFGQLHIEFQVAMNSFESYCHTYLLNIMHLEKQTSKIIFITMAVVDQCLEQLSMVGSSKHQNVQTVFLILFPSFNHLLICVSTISKLPIWKMCREMNPSNKVPATLITYFSFIGLYS